MFSPACHLHTHSDTQGHNNMHVMSEPNVHHSVLVLKNGLWEILKIWEWKSWSTDPVFVMANGLVTNFQHSFFGDGLQACSTAWIMQWQPTPTLVETNGPLRKQNMWLHVTFQKQQRSCLNSCLYNLYS